MAGRNPPDDAAPFAVVTGSAQDGGVPQMGCGCPHCSAARTSGLDRTRMAASLALVASHEGRRSLAIIDAGPDLRRQAGLYLAPVLRPEADRPRRAPFDAVMLTHLHMGHFAGLLELGPEVLDAREVLVFCTQAVAAALARNAPWSLLVSRGNLSLRPVAPGSRFEPVPGIWAEAFMVPHRDELGDTVGYRVGAAGGGQSIVYIPDADRWDGMVPTLRQLVGSVDFALLDGTFFDPAELAAATGRDPGEVPHPPVTATVAALDGLLERVIFTHLNHTNPLTSAGSPQARWLTSRGARVAHDGMRLDLQPRNRTAPVR